MTVRVAERRRSGSHTAPPEPAAGWGQRAFIGNGKAGDSAAPGSCAAAVSGSTGICHSLPPSLAPSLPPSRPSSLPPSLPPSLRLATRAALITRSLTRTPYHSETLKPEALTESFFLAARLRAPALCIRNGSGAGHTARCKPAVMAQLKASSAGDGTTEGFIRW